MDIGWMAWTLPTGIFFASVGAALLGMTALQAYRPTVPRKGFLPLVTTRGDRFFISLLSCAFIHVAWLAASDGSLLWASAISVVYAGVLMRWG